MESEMSTPVFEYEQLLHRCMGMESLVQRIVAKFDSQLDSDLEALEEAIEVWNQDKTRELAHKLKGTSLNVTATELGQISATIEIAAREGNLTECQAQLQPLRQSADRFRKEAIQSAH